MSAKSAAYYDLFDDFISLHGQESDLVYEQGGLTMGKLSDLPNIGSALEKQLMEVGITTEEELRNVGSQEAWLRILAKDPTACLNRLYALEGAIQGVRWLYLDSETKKSLKEFYRQHKS